MIPTEIPAMAPADKPAAGGAVVSGGKLVAVGREI